MSPIIRTWLALAAIGAGLIHVALVIGAPLGVGLVLAVIGLAEFAWGVMTFSGDSLPLPRIALAGATLPVLGWGLLLGASAVAEASATVSTLPFVPLAIASVFELFIAAVIGRHLRVPEPTASRGAARYLVGLVVGGLVVAALTAAALAATPAGGSTSPGGTFVVPDHGH